jgi:hypothetical protein
MARPKASQNLHPLNLKIPVDIYDDIRILAFIEDTSIQQIFVDSAENHLADPVRAAKLTKYKEFLVSKEIDESKGRHPSNGVPEAETLSEQPESSPFGVNNSGESEGGSVFEFPSPYNES